jgi:hypothetical protein
VILIFDAADIDEFWLLEHAERWQNWRGSSGGTMMAMISLVASYGRGRVHLESGCFNINYFVTTCPVVTTL